MCFGIPAALILLSSCQGSLAPVNQESYFGQVASEADFKFESYILYPKVNGKPKYENDIKSYMTNVYKHMLGRIHNVGSLYGVYNYKILSVTSYSDTLYKVNYSFSGKGVFPKELTEYTFETVLSNKNLWETSQGKCNKADPDIGSSNFWYLWDPFLKDCPLKNGLHYTSVKASLARVVQTAQTYPEYEKLVKNNEMKISVVFGFDSYTEKLREPLPNKENLYQPGAASFVNFKRFLNNQLGFASELWSEEKIRQLYNPNKGMLPYIEEFTKETVRGRMTITVFYGQTGLFAESRGFHYFLKRALKNDSVIMYEGHSGIGKNINLKMIEDQSGIKMTLNPDYQILYLGSCLPYAYYGDMYFKQKMTKEDPKGTKKLDILAYAKEAHFNNREGYNLINALKIFMDNKERYTYQKIVTDSPKDFFGVIGDEDNPTQ